MAYRKLTGLGYLLPIVFTALILGSVWVGPRITERRIRADRAGILHRLGIRDARDIRYVRVRFYREWGRGTLELSPESDGKRINELLACIGNASKSKDSKQGSYDEVVIVKRTGPPVAFHVRRGQITSVYGNWYLFACPGLTDWLNTAILDRSLWMVGYSLQPRPIISIQTDFGNGRSFRITRDHPSEDGTAPGFINIRDRSLWLLEHVDRRDFRRIDTLVDRSTTLQDLKPKPTSSDPVIYLEPSRPFSETVLVTRCNPDDLAPDEYSIPYTEDRFDVQKIAIYITSGTGQFAVALIPKTGKHWYVALDSDIRRQEINRLMQDGVRSVPLGTRSPEYPFALYTPNTDVYHRLALSIHDWYSGDPNPFEVNGIIFLEHTVDPAEPTDRTR